VPTRTVPDLLVRAMALFDPGARSVTNQLGKRTELSREKAERLLGLSPRPAEETIVDCAESLIEAQALARRHKSRRSHRAGLV
jgi:dihydroflavonol-4-reductase